MNGGLDDRAVLVVTTHLSRWELERLSSVVFVPCCLHLCQILLH
jgi:hypothetical protein